MSVSFRIRRLIVALVVISAVWAILPRVARARPQDDRPPPSGELPSIKTLPWESPDRADAVLLPRRLSSAREMLRRFQIDDSLLNTFYDRQELSSDEDEILLKILFRLPQCGRDNIQRWQHTDIPWRELSDDPSGHRTEFYRMAGRVIGIETVRLSNELSRLFQFDVYYRVQLRFDDHEHTVVLCTRTIPGRWQADPPRDERVEASAMFLKTGQAVNPSQQFVFAAAEIEWLPDGRDVDYAVRAAQLYLGSLGVNVGALDGLRQRTRLGDTDREPFYALLAASRRAGSEALARECRAAADLEMLLTAPADAAGDLMKLSAQARRITRVDVGEADIRQRYGIDHYYQIDVFVPLGDKTVMITGRDESEGPVYSNRFPATVCVLELPPELSAWAKPSPSQEKMNVAIEIPAFFLKLWSYPSQYVSTFDSRQRQIAPMFIGLQPEVRSSPSAMSPWLTIVSALLFVAAVGATWIWMWRASRSDREFNRRTLARNRELSDGAFEPLPAGDGPDSPAIDEIA